MRAAARELPIPVREGEPLAVHFLTGSRYWEQTVFCAWSLAHTTGRPIRGVVLDDGTLTAAQFESIARVCAGATLITNREIEARLDQALPESSYPTLRQRRRLQPVIRKILDPHAGLSGWKLLLDSDLLFFRRPNLLLEWFRDPFPLCATDIQNAYGYPLELLEELAGRPVRERINSGILGLRSEDFDWDRLEWWCRTLIEKGGTQYFQEQALVALFLAGRSDAKAAPIEDYVTLPGAREADECKAVMHHYVADSKRWYFRHCWRKALGMHAPA